MKKISREAGNIRFQAFSSTDGITINPVRELGPLSFLSYMAIKATLNPNGKIDCKHVQYHTHHTQDDMIIVNESRKLTFISNIVGLALLIIYLALCIRSDTRAAELIFSLFFLTYSLRFISYPIVLFSKRILGDESAKRLARFHAAEHAVINAYYDLQHVPTLEEIHEYSSYSYRCGSLHGLKYGFIFVGFALARLIPGIWFIPAMLMVCLIDFILIKTDVITFMEFFVLDKPTDTEYAVAIKAMDESVKNVDLTPYFPDVESMFKLAILAGVIGISIEGDVFDKERCKGCPCYDKCESESQDD